jgi:rubredoxin
LATFTRGQEVVYRRIRMSTEKFLFKCKKCEHIFLPWHAFMITRREGKEWKEYLYCPNCGNFKDKDDFKRD